MTERGGDRKGGPITNGDYVWTRERCREKYITLAVGHVGGGAGVHDPASLLVEVVEGGDQTGVVPCW
jgi:hypothetical protein